MSECDERYGGRQDEEEIIAVLENSLDDFIYAYIIICYAIFMPIHATVRALYVQYRRTDTSTNMSVQQQTRTCEKTHVQKHARTYVRTFENLINLFILVLCCICSVVIFWSPRSSSVILTGESFFFNDVLAVVERLFFRFRN